MLRRVALQAFVRGPSGVGDHHVDRPVDGARDPARRVGRGETGHAAPFGQQVGDENDRALHLRQGLLDAAHEQRRHQAGEEASGADEHGIELANGARDDRVDRRLRLEPQTPHLLTGLLSGIHLHLATRLRPVAVLRADGRRLHAHGPYAAAASEQPTQAIHRRQEVAAVLLHHGEQQIAAGVSGQAIVLLERRQPREQHAARLAFVARERQGALEHVAGGEHTQLVTQLPRAAAAVEHGHHGIHTQPRIVLEPAEQARKAGAAAEAADVEVPQLHRAIVRPPSRLAAAGPRRPARAGGRRRRKATMCA